MRLVARIGTADAIVKTAQDAAHIVVLIEAAIVASSPPGNAAARTRVGAAGTNINVAGTA
jgi:hypothetical protein